MEARGGLQSALREGAWGFGHPSMPDLSLPTTDLSVAMHQER